MRERAPQLYGMYCFSSCRSQFLNETFMVLLIPKHQAGQTTSHCNAKSASSGPSLELDRRSGISLRRADEFFADCKSMLHYMIHDSYKRPSQL